MNFFGPILGAGAGLMIAMICNILGALLRGEKHAVIFIVFLGSIVGFAFSLGFNPDDDDKTREE